MGDVAFFCLDSTVFLRYFVYVYWAFAFLTEGWVSNRQFMLSSDDLSKYITSIHACMVFY
jgi:hypothetical protein